MWSRSRIIACSFVVVMLSCSRFPFPFDKIDLPPAGAPREQQLLALGTACRELNKPLPIVARCCQYLVDDTDEACFELARKAEKDDAVREEAAVVLAPFCKPSDARSPNPDVCALYVEIQRKRKRELPDPTALHAAFAPSCEDVRRPESYYACKLLLDVLEHDGRWRKLAEPHCEHVWFGEESLKPYDLPACTELARAEQRGEWKLASGKSLSAQMQASFGKNCGKKSPKACFDAAKVATSDAERSRLRADGARFAREGCEGGDEAACGVGVAEMGSANTDTALLAAACRKLNESDQKMEVCERFVAAVPTRASLEMACGQGLPEACRKLACGTADERAAVGKLCTFPTASGSSGPFAPCLYWAAQDADHIGYDTLHTITFNFKGMRPYYKKESEALKPFNAFWSGLGDFESSTTRKVSDMERSCDGGEMTTRELDVHRGQYRDVTRHTSGCDEAGRKELEKKIAAYRREREAELLKRMRERFRKGFTCGR